MAQGGQAAQGLGDKIKGAANLAHGSGETLRGNINKFVDDLGNQATGHSGGSGTHSGVGENSSVNSGLHSGTGTATGHSTLSNPNGAETGGVGHAAGQGGASREVQNDVENRGVANKGVEEMQAGLKAFQKR